MSTSSFLSLCAVVLFIFCCSSTYCEKKNLEDGSDTASINGLINKDYIFKEGGLKTTTPTTTSKDEGSYYLKNGDFIDTKVKLAVVDVDFSEDIYLNLANFWCPSHCYQNKTEELDYCDYTRKNERGCKNSNSNHSSNSSSFVLPSPSCYARFCQQEKGKKWEVLEEGKSRYDKLYELGATMEYRLLHRYPCSYLRILAVPTKGQLKLEIATPMTWRNYHLQDNTTTNFSSTEEVRSFQTPWLYRSDKKGYQELSICPSDPTFELGTYFFKVTATSEYVSYRIIVESIPFDSKEIIEPEELVKTCQPIKEGWFCLDPGVPRDFFVQRRDKPKNFTVTLPKAKTSSTDGECPEYYVGTFQAISTLGDADFVISYNKPNDMSVVTFSTANDVVGWEIGSDRTTISVCLSSERETVIHIQVLSYIVESWNWTVRYIFTPQATFRRIPLPELPQLYYNYLLVGSTRMECPNMKETDSKDYFNCRWASSTIDCNSYYYLIPDVDPQPFWPRPNFFLEVSTVSLDNLTFTEIPRRPLYNRLSSSLVFQATSSSKQVSYASEKQLKLCNVTFNGRLSNSEGKPFTKKVQSLKLKNSECSVTGLQAVDDKIRDYLKSFADETETYLQRSIRYTLDVLALSNNFTSCFALADSLIKPSGNKTVVDFNTTTCLGTPGSPAYNENPCCNVDLLWNTTCCEPKSQIKRTEVVYSADEEMIEEQCNDFDCTVSYTEDFRLEKQKLESDVFTCSNPFVESTYLFSESFIPFINCRDEYFGVNQTLGLNCEKDSDCIDRRCDVMKGYCLNAIQKQEERFVHCIVEDLEPFIIDFLKRKYEIESSDASSIEKELLDRWTTKDCVSKYEIGLPYRDSWAWGTTDDHNPVDPQAPSCVSTCPHFAALDPKAILPPACAPESVSCKHLWYAPSGPSKERCEKSVVCNWMNCTELGLTREECEIECNRQNETESFCGLCENDKECIEITELNSEEMCNQAISCIHRNAGITSINLSHTGGCNSTQSFHSCTVPCYERLADGTIITRDCLNREECEQSGICGRSMEYLQPLGGCVFPADPFDDPGCGGSNWVGSTPTEFGCLYHVLEAECTRFKGTWLRPVISKAECLAYGLGCEIMTGTFTSYRNPEIISHVGTWNCRSCGDKVVPIMNWQPGVWMESIPRKLSWRNRESFQKFTFEKTLSFTTIFDDVNTAVNLKFGFLLLAEAQCRFSKIMELLETLSCTCASSEGSDCYRHFQREVPSGTVAVCSGEDTILSTPPAKITFHLGSEEERLEGCSNVTVSFISALEFKTPIELSLSSYLISPQQPESDFGFLNDKKAEIGQVFADGILIAVSGKKLESVYVCVTERGDVDLDFDRFFIYDFAIPGLDQRELIPLELEVEILEGGFYCAEIKDPFEKTYYPVIRLKHWKGAIPYSDPEIILIYIAGAVYAIVAAYGLLQLAEFVIYRQLKFQMNHHIVWMIFLLNLVRGIYFFLLASQVIMHTPSIIEVLLVEGPAFLYFSAFTFLVLLWAVITRAVSRRVSTQEMNFGRILYVGILVLDALLVTLLVALILLFEFLPAEDTSSCGGRVYQPLSSWTARRITNAIYRYIIAGFAVLLGVFVNFYGVKIWMSLRGQAPSATKTASSEARRKRKITIIVLATAGSSGLLVQSIYLIVLVSVGFSNNIATIAVLIGSEALTSLVVLYLLHPGKEQGHSLTKTISFRSSFSSIRKGESQSSRGSSDSRNESSDNSVPSISK